MSLDRDSISHAARRIAPYVRRTPVMDVWLDGIVRPVTLKLELLQHAGSFKARGAFNNLVGLEPMAVTAASGGNHGAAVAYAAARLGHQARIFVPEISAPAKVARIAAYGAEIVQKGANYQESLGLCEAYVAASGALNVHAYNTEVKQESARVEAFLHVVPYGQGPGVPAFAGSGYGTTGPYTIAAYPTDQAQPNVPPPPVDPANNYAPAQTGVAPQNYPQQMAQNYAPAAYSAPSGPPPIRNVMRAPKNALTNEGLVTLAQVGYDEDFILDLMRQKNCRFDTSVEGLAYMATHGLTERIVKAALKAEAENLLTQQLEARR